MPLSGCSNALAATALFTLLLLPAQYYLPNFPSKSLEPKLHVELPETINPSDTPYSLFPFDFDLPAVDLFITVSLVVIAFVTYLADWIQRKIMERRIIKLNQHLNECVEGLRVWDMRQEQLEVTLRMVQNASSEYNLLLYLLLRQNKFSSTWKTHCEKELDVFNLNTSHLDICGDL